VSKPFDMIEIKNSHESFNASGRNSYKCFESLIGRYGMYVFECKNTGDIFYVGEAHDQDLKDRITQNYTEDDSGGTFRDNWLGHSNNTGKSFDDFEKFLENCTIKTISINSIQKYAIIAIESMMVLMLNPIYNK